MWIAHIAPYTNQNLAKLLRSFHSHPHVKRETRGKTVGSRDILLLTVTNPKVSDEKKRVVWLMARQHSWERSEEHTSELQSRQYLVCRLLLEKKNKQKHDNDI